MRTSAGDRPSQQRRACRLRVCSIFLGGALVLLGCPGPRDESAQRLERLEEDASGMAAVLGETRAEQRNERPGTPATGQRAAGEAVAVDEGFVSELMKGGAGDDDCPVTEYTTIRAEVGNNCATYAAEITTWIGRCVAECDKNDLDQRAIRLAMGRCSAWCTSKSCNKASFVPPPAGCAASDCYDSTQEPCENEECALREYCSLLSTTRPLNCFCTDIIIE